LSKRILAWLNLAYRMGIHVLFRLPFRPFRRGRDFARFTGQVEPEGYRPLLADERAEFPTWMNCVHCGLCSLACPEIAAAPATAWDEAWTFVAGASRSLDRAELVAPQLAPCTRCAACQAVCPTGVPITHMAAALTRLRGTPS